jgi:hypothetical protein
MPKWFYAPKKSLEATSNEGYVRKQMKNLPHTATALLRRHEESLTKIRRQRRMRHGLPSHDENTNGEVGTAVREYTNYMSRAATSLFRRHGHSILKILTPRHMRRRLLTNDQDTPPDGPRSLFLATASSVNFSRVQAARSQTDHGSPFSRGPRRRLLQMDCAAGEVRNVDSDTCMQCPVGQFSSAGDTICSDCAPGKCKCQQRARVSGIERHERADNGLCAGFGCQVVVSLIKEWTKALRGCKAESLPECQ